MCIVQVPKYDCDCLVQEDEERAEYCEHYKLYLLLHACQLSVPDKEATMEDLIFKCDEAREQRIVAMAGVCSHCIEMLAARLARVARMARLGRQ
jgi:hypothetical protein